MAVVQLALMSRLLVLVEITLSNQLPGAGHRKAGFKAPCVLGYNSVIFWKKSTLALSRSPQMAGGESSDLVLYVTM